MKEIIIIGGGASGLMAAVMAARNGARVTVLERMQRVGKKLLATGNGRCNLTNRRLDASHYHGASPEFLDAVFRQFGLDQTLAFFDELGVPVVEEDGGKLFPQNQQASSVLDVLRYEMTALGVTEVCDVIVHVVQRKQGTIQCICGNGQTFAAQRVIVCAGGKSSPNLGSNGGGFKIAQALGHTLIEPFPALVQGCLDAPYLNHVAGVALQGQAQVFVDGVLQRAETGELLFAKYGISGTAILQVSRVISESTQNNRDTRLRLDLFPEHSPDALAARIQERIAKNPAKPIDFCFVGFLHKRLISVLLRIAGIESLQRPCGELTPAEIARVAAVLKSWEIPCTGTQSWMFSQVTAGGVDTREVDPVTLESQCAPGIHFAGEVLDVDGDSGGYNLQWAWSSGAVAGIHAALLD
jgi:predicted Rossmann fold flavoprotein